MIDIILIKHNFFAQRRRLEVLIVSHAPLVVSKIFVDICHAEADV